MKITDFEALKEKGYEIILSDLYAMKFNPFLTATDFPG
jgi:NAD(P)H dehydrogenase (quinone)